MNKKGYAFVILLSVTAGLFLFYMPWPDISDLNLRIGIGACAFLGLALATQLLSINFSVSSDNSVASAVTFLPLFAAAVVLPPAFVALIAAVVGSVTELAFNRRVTWRTLFNLSQYVLCYGFAALIYDKVYEASTFSLSAAGAFFLIPAIFFSSNVFIISLIFSILEEKPLANIIKQVIGPAGGNLWYDFLASPIALIAAILYMKLYIAGLVLIILPILLIRYSYQSRSKLEQVNRELLGVLVKALETRDPYTSGHSIRVSILARMIGEDLGLPRKRLEQVEAAAVLHDIGKMDPVFSAVIAKRGSLSDDERALIRTHTIKGAELLEAMAPSLGDDVILSVRHHHEWYNGGGYPDGLKGDKTPLPARIIAVCDAIDAMLSVRPYRSARTPEQTRNELSRCVGGQFDPKLTRVATAGDMIERAAERIRDIGEDNDTYIPRSA